VAETRGADEGRQLAQEAWRLAAGVYVEALALLDSGDWRRLHALLLERAVGLGARSNASVNKEKSMSDKGILSGRRAVVTGAGRGIGRAEALALAEAGAEVVVNYSRSEDAALAVVDEIKARGGRACAIGADMADPVAVGKLMSEARSRLGGIDILCSNAGVEHFGALGEVTAEDFDRVFAVNTRGQLLAVKEAVPHMGPGGRIVCTSSVSAAEPFPKHALYSGSKAAVEAMVRCLALDLAALEITINAIAPGGTTSDMAAAYGHHYETDLAPHRLPFGRLGQPADIAKVVRFLVSDDSAWITGQTIRVSGGQ
jgi:NAD(P)-dependent dehydrogenase (short-subunit alcohol dehydrogenase family)